MIESHQGTKGSLAETGIKFEKLNEGEIVLHIEDQINTIICNIKIYLSLLI